MSSFICSSEHFNSVEAKLHLLAAGRGFYLPYSLRDICPKWYNKQDHLIEPIEQEISYLIDVLRLLNVVCVSLQYKSHYEGILDQEIQEQITLVKTKTETKEITLHGLYNALRCINYQIEIDHLQELRELTPEEGKALEFLKLITISIGQQIISNLPDDRSNIWEID